MTNWDDYRYFATLAQTGSVRASAELLGVNPSTVTRRLDGLESRLEQKLFVRSHAGLQLTADGRLLLERLEPLALELAGLDAQFSGTGAEMAGTVRITIPDVLAIILMEEFARYSLANPGVRLEFIPAYRALDLMRGQADMALRVTDRPPEELVGRQLGYTRLAVYGSREYLKDHDPFRAPEAAAWIESGVEAVRAPAFRSRYFPRVPSGVRCNSLLLQQAAAAAHLCITLLPCALGDADPRLARVGDLEPLEARPVWLLFPQELRGVARIRSVSEFLQDAFLRLEPRLLGDLDRRG